MSDNEPKFPTPGSGLYTGAHERDFKKNEEVGKPSVEQQLASLRQENTQLHQQVSALTENLGLINKNVESLGKNMGLMTENLILTAQRIDALEPKKTEASSEWEEVPGRLAEHPDENSKDEPTGEQQTSKQEKEREPKPEARPNVSQTKIEIDPRILENATRALWVRMPKLDIKENKDLTNGWKIIAEIYKDDPNLRISGKDAEKIIQESGLKGVFGESELIELKPYVNKEDAPGYNLEGVLVESYSTEGETKGQRTGTKWLPLREGEKPGTLGGRVEIPTQAAQILLISAGKAIGPISTKK